MMQSQLEQRLNAQNSIINELNNNPYYCSLIELSKNYKSYDKQTVSVINDIVYKYSKSKDNNISEELIKAYIPFLINFTILLLYGHVVSNLYTDDNGKTKSYTSKPILSFLRFYSKSKIKNNKIAYRAACYRIKTIYSPYGFDFLFNETVTALLEMALVFPNKNKGTDNINNFKSFVDNQYQYYISNRLSKLYDVTNTAIREDLYSNFYIDFDSIHDKYNNYLNIKNYKGLKLKNNYSDDINFNWIFGITCSDIFKDLTNYERILIKEIFYNNSVIIDVAKLHGNGVSNTYKDIRLIIKRVKEKASYYHLIKEE